MNFNVSEFNEICRLCLQNKKNLEVISQEFLIMLQSFMRMKINNDGLPEHICSECSQQTFICFKFKEQCENSNIILQEILKGHKLLISKKNRVDEIDVKSENGKTKLKHTDEKIDLSIENETNKINLSKSMSTSEIIKISNNEVPSDTHELVYLNTHTKECNFSDDFSKVSDIQTYSELSVTVRSNAKDPVNRTRVKKVSSLGLEKCDISTFTCKICNKTLACLYSLARHMELHDEHRKFRFLCPICNKGFYERSSLKKHLSRHKGVVRYKCDVCSNGFYELSALSVHMKKHKVKPTSCEICNKQFLVKLQYEIHMKTHSTEKRYKCEKCDKKFNKLYYLKSHLISHIDERNYPCFLCDKEFKTDRNLKVHHKRCHTNIPKKTEVCNVCGKSIIKYNMKYHLIRHTGAKEYKCSQCTRAFCQIYDLRAHYKLKHESRPKVNIYLCSVCGKRCVSAGDLNIHSRIHAHIRPTFACEICEKKYKTKCGLKQHIRCTHMDERPHICNICEKGFHTTRILQHHMRTHTGEKPFSCNLCQRAFSQKSALSTHMKVHLIKIN